MAKQETAENVEVVGEGRDLIAELEGENVQIIPINEVNYLTVSDAVKVSDFSRAYINKLLNGDKLVGMNLKGLGWLVSIDSLREFESTDRRQPGKARLVSQALEEFLKINGLWEAWTQLRDDVVAQYDATKAAAEAAQEQESKEAEEVAAE